MEESSNPAGPPPGLNVDEVVVESSDDWGGTVTSDETFVGSGSVDGDPCEDVSTLDVFADEPPPEQPTMLIANIEVRAAATIVRNRGKCMWSADLFVGLSALFEAKVALANADVLRRYFHQLVASDPFDRGLKGVNFRCR